MSSPHVPAGDNDDAVVDRVKDNQEEEIIVETGEEVAINMEPVETTPPPEEPDVVVVKPTTTTTTAAATTATQGTSHPLFDFMAKYPWPFLVAMPILLACLIGFGWTIDDDKVETEVANIWIPEDGDYAKDVDYAKSVGRGDLAATSFAAMAISRDGKNILTSSRLQEITDRMRETEEETTIEYKGITYTWDDLCYSNSAPYQFPCLRLTAMDLFQESEWAFHTFDRVAWYQNIVQKLLVKPRLPRFGVMQQDCAAQCGDLLFARRSNPLALFGDIGNMEFSDPCRICIETAYEIRVEEMHAGIAPTFGVLAMELGRYAATLPPDDPQLASLQQQIQNLQTLATSVTKDDIVEFFPYYVTRDLYAQLGYTAYMAGYEQMKPVIQACQVNQQALGLTCPPVEITPEQAKQHLRAHADNLAFSSVTTAGSPLPFWDQGGEGAMFANTAGTLSPVSGSGLDMSASPTSLAVYLDVLNYGQPTWSPQYGADGYAVPGTADWQSYVETNPFYAWFMASVTDADESTVCGNGELTGSDTAAQLFNTITAGAAKQATEKWCTPFNAPRAPIEGTKFSKQHFARMWYDLLLSSPGFLDIEQGTDNPYSWTTGAGCDYTLAGERFAYTNQTEDDILHNASREVYNIDEGVTLGAVDRNILIGGADPSVGEYNYENPLKEVTVVQTLYAALVTKDIVKRVQNCNRPQSLKGPQIITEEDAEEILYAWKEAMEETWSKDWDDPDKGEVQFVSFFDDGGGAIGSTGRMLRDITLDNTKLTFISIAIIAIFSAIFLFSSDLVESRILVTLVGVALVVCSFFAALGLGLLVGTKINVTIAWTLPFIIIGLGVDDVYIILLALKKQGGYTARHWNHAMSEVVIEVTMTSLVNLACFGVISLSDIPAVYLSAQIACYCIIGLYASVIFCYPAYCLLDFRRQEAGRRDILFCLKKDGDEHAPDQKEDFRNTYLYERFYKKIVLGDYRQVVHGIIVVVTLVLFVVGIYGITERQIGLGLEDFFPEDNPASRWASYRTGELASWSVSMNWGALDYGNPKTQMQMIGQFEGVVTSPHIAEIDTKQLWMADFLIWTSRHCSENFDRDNFDEKECGRDQYFEEEGSYCAGTWAENESDLLRLKAISDPASETCNPFEGGICRPVGNMHPLDLVELGLNETSGKSYCPVVEGWSGDKWKFCLRQWRSITGSHGRLVEEGEPASGTMCSGVFNNDAEVKWPIPYSGGPTMFSYGLFSHQETLDMMSETGAVCDDDENLHCWMSGIPFDYWTQYIGIFEVLMELAGYSTLTGFGIALIFLLGNFSHEGYHTAGSIVSGSIIGAFLIALTIIFTLVPVIGLSILVNVNLTGFSNMGFVLSVGFAVEYSVHVVSRWMRADMSLVTSFERVEYAMSFLMLPTFMSFVSSTIGVICLAFTEFEFNTTFFFKPLIIVMFVSYWMGCWFLPVLLIYLDFDMVKLGMPVEMGQEEQQQQTEAKRFDDSSEGADAPVDDAGNESDPVSNPAVGSSDEDVNQGANQ